MRIQELSAGEDDSSIVTLWLGGYAHRRSRPNELLSLCLAVTAGIAVTLVTVVTVVGASPDGSAASTPRAATSSGACKTQLSTFAASATEGTYTSPGMTVAFPAPVTLANPASPGAMTTAHTSSIPFTVYGANGASVTPSSTAPATLSIYGAPAGSIKTTPKGSGTSPIVVSVTSGSSISFTYTGAYLSRPPTILASMPLAGANACTGTDSYAIGSTTIALDSQPTALGTESYSTPTTCYSGTTGRACATENVGQRGLALSAAVGFGAVVPSSASARVEATSTQPRGYAIDTGSIGTAVPLAQLGPDAIGPGAPALKYYNSSGNEFIGYVYLAPVTFQMGSVQAVTDPIRVLAVMSSACHPGSKCKKAPPFKNFHYLGVGFDRGKPLAYDPFESPRDNALLAVEPEPGSTMSQGYVLSGSTITAGITASDSARASPVRLSANPGAPGDWLGAPACVSFPTFSNTSPTPVCGSMLVDVGIPEMFITFSSAKVEPLVVSRGLTSNQTISIAAPSPSSPSLGYSFSSGPAKRGQVPPPTGMTPRKVQLSVIPGGTAPVFINTGRHVLFEYEYLYNAQSGEVGFIPLERNLR